MDVRLVQGRNSPAACVVAGCGASGRALRQAAPHAPAVAAAARALVHAGGSSTTALTLRTAAPPPMPAPAHLAHLHTPHMHTHQRLAPLTSPLHAPPPGTGEGGGGKLSKKQRKLLSRLRIADLKQKCERPEVVEVWDATAPDAETLVFLKVWGGWMALCVCVCGTVCVCVNVMCMCARVYVSACVCCVVVLRV